MNAAKQVATTDYAVEGDFISADEWNEDQFNKATPNPVSAQAEALRQGMFNQGMNAQQQGVGQGLNDGVLGGLMSGIFGWAK